MLVVMAGAFAAAPGCGSPDYGDPGPSWAGFANRFRTSSISTEVLVVVVDDRPSREATELRAGIGAAIHQLGGRTLGEYDFLSPDRAAWRPVDMRLVLVPASSSAIESVASPATDPALAWTANQATREGREALIDAAVRNVARMASPPGAAFRPLERAAEIVKLLRGTRAPSNAAESTLLAGTMSGRRQHFFIGAVIVAATDDESPQPVPWYRLYDTYFEWPLNVVTLEQRGKEPPDAVRYPRLAEWVKGTHPGVGACFDDDMVEPPFELFPHGLCAGYRFRCDRQPIAQISPGLGACHIEITTVEPSTCDASRGWADPMDADGVRRPRVDASGERVCEVEPVEASAMSACMHDETCADCGSGWCVSEIQPKLAERCPLAPRAGLRFIGGALPSGGWLRVTCLEPNDSPAP
jgi:hypothetical protein